MQDLATGPTGDATAFGSSSFVTRLRPPSILQQAQLHMHDNAPVMDPLECFGFFFSSIMRQFSGGFNFVF